MTRRSPPQSSSVSAGLAIIIPPSISFIVYGDIMQQSVGTLFAAGVVPGLVVASFLCVAVLADQQEARLQRALRGVLPRKSFLR